MDPKTFGAIPIEQMDPIECPACHRTHRWGREDALFEREDPKQKVIEAVRCTLPIRGKDSYRQSRRFSEGIPINAR